jgi:hypothetical protein
VAKAIGGAALRQLAVDQDSARDGRGTLIGAFRDIISRREFGIVRCEEPDERHDEILARLSQLDHDLGNFVPAWCR